MAVLSFATKISTKVAVENVSCHGIVIDEGLPGVALAVRIESTSITPSTATHADMICDAPLTGSTVTDAVIGSLASFPPLYVSLPAVVPVICEVSLTVHVPAIRTGTL